ncbi:MAG: hypothetical protein ACLFR1_05190 [Spirochaetia bacterium]
MKKLTLLLIVLLAFTGLAFAETEANVSGSASMTFGINLDDPMAMGFVNSNSVDVILPLYSGGDSNGGDDDLYGEISVSNLGLHIKNGSVEDVDGDNGVTSTGSVSAKIVAGNVFVQVFGAPGYGVDYAAAPDGAYNINAHGDWMADTGGMAVGYDDGMVAVTAKVSSIGDYRDHDAGATDDDTTVDAWYERETDDSADATDYPANNTQYQFVFGLDGSLTMDMISVPFAVTFDGYSTPQLVVVGGLKPTFDLGEGTVSLGVDAGFSGDDFGFEVAPGLTYNLVEDGSNVALDVFFGMYNVMGVETNLTKVAFTFTETETDGFVENAMIKVGADATITEFAFDDTLGWNADLDLSYNASGIKPYVNFGYGSDDAFDLGAGVEVSADASGIDNTTITLDYTSSNLMDGADMGIITAEVGISF